MVTYKILRPIFQFGSNAHPCDTFKRGNFSGLNILFLKMVDHGLGQWMFGLCFNRSKNQFVFPYVLITLSPKNIGHQGFTLGNRTRFIKDYCIDFMAKL